MVVEGMQHITNLGETSLGWTSRLLSRLLMAFLALGIAGLVVLPWQQSVQGRGQVVALSPNERLQVLEAPVDGRVVDWQVLEGQRVKAGTLLGEMADNDPKILERIRLELEAAESQVQAATLSIAALEGRIASMKVARSAAITGVDEKTKVLKEKLNALQQEKQAADAKKTTAELNIERQRNLHARGLVSKRALELAELEYQTTVAGVERQQAKLAGARSEILSNVSQSKKIGSSEQASIESAKASLQSLYASRAKAEADRARVQVRLSRQQSMRIMAPRDGTVMRLWAKAGGEMLKAGDSLITFVPETTKRAVEIWVDGNDAPLVTPGSEVRLQFEGWPAVQFVGWPSVAVGTFAGSVYFVDASDDGKGRFRVLIVPLVDGDDRAWPDARYLRQGVRANGWVLLNRVRVGYEIWRQLNGFPPVVERNLVGQSGSANVKDKGDK